jgi:NOL1/NOP2/sun family putative RNA methylase
MNLPLEFVRQMERELGGDAPAFFASYEEESWAGLRANAGKGYAPGEGMERVPWCPDGYYVPRGLRPGKDPLHAAGAYYLQEPSAMAPAQALAVRPGMRVLDLCAAPGGKSTQLAQAMGGEGVLVANEIHPARARILLENVERMGVTNAVVLNETPARVAAHFGAWFDAVLVDAPCSGEGMFRRDEKAAEEWSADAPQRCHERQMEILDCAARCLRGGGTLVYSTCTYNRTENERTVEAFLERHPDFALDEGLKMEGIPCKGGMAHLYPHQLRGEGHFLARMRRGAGGESERSRLPLEGAEQRYLQFARENLVSYAPAGFWTQGEWLYAPPEGTPDVRGLKVLRAGVQVGRLLPGRMEPAHALALALRPEQAIRREAVGREDALRFLAGEALEGEMKGWGLVTYRGFALGWGKGSDGQIKNHIPKGLRVKWQ